MKHRDVASAELDRVKRRNVELRRKLESTRPRATEVIRLSQERLERNGFVGDMTTLFGKGRPA